MFNNQLLNKQVNEEKEVNKYHRRPQNTQFYLWIFWLFPSFLVFLRQEKYVIISKLIKQELSNENKITF